MADELKGQQYDISADDLRKTLPMVGTLDDQITWLGGANMTQLSEFAKLLEISGRSGMAKDDLIQAILIAALPGDPGQPSPGNPTGTLVVNDPVHGGAADVGEGEGEVKDFPTNTADPALGDPVDTNANRPNNFPPTDAPLPGDAVPALGNPSTPEIAGQSQLNVPDATLPDSPDTAGEDEDDAESDVREARYTVTPKVAAYTDAELLNEINGCETREKLGAGVLSRFEMEQYLMYLREMIDRGIAPALWLQPSDL